MAERDRFELDLVNALRAYAQDAPTEVRPAELARQFATTYPHGGTSIGPWRLPAALRPAWVLLLLAGLLAALVGGTLLVGSQLQRKLPAFVPPVGQVYVCPPGSNPDKPGPVDQARPTKVVPTVVAFDRRAGRLVAVTSASNGVETWTFDVCTNTWTQMRPSREPPRFGVVYNASLVYDVDSDLTIWVLEGVAGFVWTYDLEANTWTEKGITPIPVGHAVYDPLSGLIVASDLSEPVWVWTYDVEADAWTRIPRANGGPGPGAGFAYDASVDRIIAIDNPTRLLDIRTGTWSRSSHETPNLTDSPMTSPSTIAYDEAAMRTVVVGGPRVAAYDAAADRWEILADADTPWPGDPADRGRRAWMAYDSVNRRLVGPRVHGDDVLAFDTRTREWTVLVEPSEEQPAP